MTAAASNSPQPYEVPEGGLGSFLTATVGDWSDEALNADNYYDIVKPTAEQLAAFGREEDDRIAHVATGETVIPMAVFEEDPALKEVLFSRMRDMGIDPERYVVGNQLNSINPVTGQPEFFLKKIFKGIKKAVKGVVKVFKKIAPIVLSIAGSLMLGPIGAALGSGIGTLIQGGNLKDAFKSAAIAGITAGVTQGISDGIGEGVGLVEGTSYLDQLGSASGIFNPTGEALSPISEANPANIRNIDPNLAVAKTTAGANPANITGEALKQTQQSASNFFSPEGPAGALSQSANTSADIAAQEAAKLKAQGLATGTANTNITPGLTSPGTPSYYTPGASAKTIAQNSLDRAAQTKATGSAADAAGSAADAAGSTTGATISGVGDITTAVRQAADPGFFASMKKFFLERDFDALKQAFLPGTKPEVIKAKLARAGFNVTDSAVKEIAEALAPNMLRSYGPLAGLGMGIMGLTGGFEQPEMEELEGGFGPSLPPYPFAQPGSLYKPIAAAMGGEINDFPRKNGPINGPGTGTSDDIPAMLSDGEFVMTAKAVRGAGNGSRQAGMNRMYDMMRRYEGAA